MNIFLQEWKSYRKSSLIWTLSLAAMVAMFMAAYPAFAEDSKQLTKMIEGYPSELLKALGADIKSITTFLGFYSYIHNYVVLSLAIQGMNYGLSVLSKEMSGKTADFLLTKPVTRNQILTAKLLAIIAAIVVTNAILAVATYVTAVSISDNLDTGALMLFFLKGFIVQLFFVVLGLTVSVIGPVIKSVLSISMTTVFSFYIVNMIGSIIGEKAARYITPFQYFQGSYIIEHNALESTYLLLSLTLIVAGIVLSYVMFSKKDVHAI